MKSLLGKVSYVLLFVFATSQVVSQEYHVEQYGTAQGLSNPNISDVHKDSYGYLWVATGHGLNLYNGLNFEIFRYDPEDSFSIRANSLGRLFEDSESDIWVTLDVGGVSRYDRHTGKFHYYTYDPANGADPNNFVNDLLIDSGMKTWLATNTHINLLNEESGLYTPVAVAGHDQLRVYSIYEDNSADLWIGTSAGLFRYDTEKQHFAEILDNSGQQVKEVVRFVEDGDGLLWCAGSYDIYQIRNREPKLISRPSGRFISNLFKDSEDRVLISQYEDNMYIWTGKDWQVPDGFVPPAGGMRFAHTFVGLDRTVIADNEGNFLLYDQVSGVTNQLAFIDDRIRSFWFGPGSNELWLGGIYRGLYKVDLQAKPATQLTFNTVEDTPQHPFRNHVAAIVPTGPDEVLISAGSKLFTINTHTQAKKPFLGPGWSEMERSGISAMKVFSDKKVLVSTSKGFYELDKQSRQSTQLNFLAQEHTYDFLVDGDSIWSIGTYGLAMHSLKSDRKLLFSELAEVPEILKGSEVRALHKDAAGTIWVGVVREGLFRIRYNASENKFEVDNFRYAGVRKGPFKSQTVNDITEDRLGRLWVAGFSSGLLSFDREKEVFVNHNPESELPIPNVQAMLESEDGAIWLSALDGIHRYDPESGHFQKFTVKDGLSTAPFAFRSAALMKDGMLTFGTEEGLTLFKIPEESQEPFEHQVHLQRLKVQNDGTDLRFPSENAPLTFKYNQNFLSFDFISLNYHDTDKVSYQYRLEGLETQWNTSKNREVQYANLKPGNYAFEVRAGIDGSVWSEQVTRFQFTIAKPFWWQDWFLTLVLFVVLALVYAFYRFRLNVKLSKVRALETIRQNAAADFHDEMGNKLTRISLFTEVLEKKLNGTSPEIKSYVNKIKDNSHVLNNSMRDFLWALDPGKDTAFDLIVMLKDFGDELFDNSDIRFHVDSIKEIFREYPLDMEWKRQLVMIFKEAMHNALKYSEANKVTLKASLSKDVLNLSLTDDGKGFEVKGEHNGYGQANMKRRAEQLGASISIESQQGEGTVVTFIGTLTKKYEIYD